MSQPRERVVIVGGSGFVGRRLGEHLRGAGGDVLALSSADVDLRSAGAGGKLAAALRPGDAVVMCSALTPEHGRDASTFIANASMAKETGDAIMSATPAFVVYMSSDAVYADGPDLVSESSPVGASNLYGLAHLARERMFIDATARARVPLAILRPCAVYGPGDTHGSYGPNRFIRTALAEGAITLFGAGEERRDHLFVADLCRVVSEVVAMRVTGSFNVASGRATSFMEVARTVAGLLPNAVRIVEAPRAPGSVITHRSLDIAALRSALPDLSMTELGEGLRQTIGAAAR